MTAESRVEPGDGRALERYRWWQLFSRSLFHLRVVGDDGTAELWSIDVRHGGDENGEVRAQLYRDGLHRGQAEPPAAFRVSGGRVEVATSMFGLRRCHYVADDGTVRQLVPDPRSAEGRRARLNATHPATSRMLGVASTIVLIVALVLGVPQIIEQLTRIPLVAESIGTFVSPIQLPVWMNTALLLATLAASTERALRLRYSWLLDGGIFEGGD